MSIIYEGAFFVFFTEMVDSIAHSDFLNSSSLSQPTGKNGLCFISTKAKCFLASIQSKKDFDTSGHELIS